MSIDVYAQMLTAEAKVRTKQEELQETGRRDDENGRTEADKHTKTSAVGELRDCEIYRASVQGPPVA